MGRSSGSRAHLLVIGVFCALYGSAECALGECEFNGIGYSTGEVVALLEETCTSMICTVKEDDQNITYISTKPMSSCHCNTPEHRATGDVPKLKYPLRLKEGDDFAKGYKVRSDAGRGFFSRKCQFNGQAFGKKETVASFPDRCFDLVCIKHQDGLAIEASVNASCSCEDLMLWTTHMPTTESGGGGPSLNCGTYQDITPDHSMCLPPNSDCHPFQRGVPDSDKKLILKLHNELREKVAKGLEKLGDPGPQPPATNMRELVWNNELASVAQAWAEQCPYSHDCYRCRKIKERSYSVGQNIFWSFGSDSKEQWKLAVDYFYNEVMNLPRDVVDSFGSVPVQKVITHYTQLVWASTYEIGCGVIHNECKYKGVDYKVCKTYVCNYGPAANVKNRPIYEKGPTASNCPEGKSSNYKGLCK
ncbi:CRISP/Allergen/PR-1-like [Macrobrachium nipponense]|uniref:CRISP/Allergen/PR-1-like n=1 Tax=Macrobrachium nipponense TaxID=159736 RepID=UPI0030C818E4